MVEMKLWLVIVAAVALVLAGVVAFFLGVKYRMKVAEAELGSAEEEAKRLISDAIKTAESKKKEALVEAKDEIYRMKSEADREVKERRSEVQRQEHRLQQKEENLDKKIDNLEKKEEAVQRRQAEADERLQEVEQIKKSQFEMLEKVSGFSKEQAKDYMLQMLENELTHEKALKITQYEQQLKEESDEKAREILSTAIQRCASDHVAEVTVSVVPLPSDEMKGRIIGREGRNIRTLENLTGVDLIIDDTPEAITLSCHDPVKREVARLSLEKLIQDGRIHPTRIEETVEKARREVETKIKQDGERAVIETGVHHLHPELMKLLGVYILGAAASYGQGLLMSFLSQRAINKLRKDLFDKLQEMPIPRFKNRGMLLFHARFTKAWLTGPGKGYMLDPVTIYLVKVPADFLLLRRNYDEHRFQRQARRHLSRQPGPARRGRVYPVAPRRGEGVPVPDQQQRQHPPGAPSEAGPSGPGRV